MAIHYRIVYTRADTLCATGHSSPTFATADDTNLKRTTSYFHDG